MTLEESIAASEIRKQRRAAERVENDSQCDDSEECSRPSKCPRLEFTDGGDTDKPSQETDQCSQSLNADKCSQNFNADKCSQSFNADKCSQSLNADKQLLVADSVKVSDCSNAHDLPGGVNSSTCRNKDIVNGLTPALTEDVEDIIEADESVTKGVKNEDEHVKKTVNGESSDKTAASGLDVNMAEVDESMDIETELVAKAGAAE